MALGICLVIVLCCLRPQSIASGSLWSGFLLPDPKVDSRIEEIEWENTAVQHLVVEGTQVEFGAQFLLGSFTKLVEL